MHSKYRMRINIVLKNKKTGERGEKTEREKGGIFKQTNRETVDKIGCQMPNAVFFSKKSQKPPIFLKKCCNRKKKVTNTY